MKITNNQYALTNDHRLKIISNSDDGTDTSINIDMSNLSFFVGKTPQYLIDLFYLSTIVYGIDRAINRKKSIDGWSRCFDVTVKIVSDEQFTQNKERIDAMLSFLTGDFWNIRYEHIEALDIPSHEIKELDDQFDQVNLFSGGLDSFIGAIDYLADKHIGKLCLVSHNDYKMRGAKDDQKSAIGSLRQYTNNFYHFPSVDIFPLISEEKTCRSRSFIFISIAALFAEYKHIGIIVPENGSVSLNFPLSPSRRAACSTRTTHVLFINQLKELIKSLGSNIEITNPYEFMTKGAMVRNCNNQVLLVQNINSTNSCGKRFTKQNMTDHSATHCGRCMPCMYRRASLIGFNDNTKYGDTFSQLFNSRQRSDDFFAMLNFLRHDFTDEEIRKELRIAGLGRLPTFEYYVQLVKDTREELKNMLKQQAPDNVKKFIGLI